MKKLFTAKLTGIPITLQGKPLEVKDVPQVILKIIMYFMYFWKMLSNGLRFET